MSESEKIGRARGGIERAKKLSKEKKTAIAKMGAKGRWNLKNDPNSTQHEGNLRIGDLSIPCAVLQSGERVISRRGMANLLGRKIGGTSYEKGTTLIASNLMQFMTEDVQSIIDNPIEYKSGRSTYLGIKAEIIPKVSEIWLKARDAEALTSSQLHIAAQAEIIMRALAQVGIISLIDEATGYQDVRDRNALQQILDMYLSREFSVWAKRVPDEFYHHIFRLRGWEWRGMRVNRPQVVAKYTKDLIYARLAPGVLDELEKRNPTINGHRRSKHHQWLTEDIGHRRSKHHQWLTEDIGHPKLSEHIYAIMALMRASQTWGDFMRIVDIALPKKEETLKRNSMIDLYSSTEQEPPDELFQIDVQEKAS